MSKNSLIINKVLGNSKGKFKSQSSKWYDYLISKINCPFQATILDSENDELKVGDKVMVTNIEDLVDMYGLLVRIKKGRRQYIFPICDLEILEKESENFVIIDAFLEWWWENR